MTDSDKGRLKTIAEFCFARLDEKEAAAKATTPVRQGRWRPSRDKHAEPGAPLHLVQGAEPRAEEDHGEYASTPIIAYSAEWQTEAQANLRFIAANNPAHVLADIAAKRRIVELCAKFPAGKNWGQWHTDNGIAPTPREQHNYDYILRLLAAADRDHPDYDASWAPPPTVEEQAAALDQVESEA